jgi:hypothetical protein
MFFQLCVPCVALCMQVGRRREVQGRTSVAVMISTDGAHLHVIQLDTDSKDLGGV